MGSDSALRTMIQLTIICLLVLCEISGYQFCQHGTFYDYGKDAEICCDTACEFDPNTGNVNYRCKEECPAYAEILVQCDTDEAYINKVQREKNCIPCSEVCSKYSETVCKSKCKGFKTGGCEALTYYNSAHEVCRRCKCKDEESCKDDNCMDFYSLCHPNPCGDGNCSVDFETKSYVCECPKGWTGQNCSQATVNDAKCESTCENGNCTVDDESGAVICQCNQGWGGETCSEAKKTCSSKPCQNEGICQHNGDEYTCFCSFPYFGRHCEVNLIIVAVAISVVFILVILVSIVIHCRNKKKQKRNHVVNLQLGIGKNGETQTLMDNGESAGASSSTVNSLATYQQSLYSRNGTLHNSEPRNISQNELIHSLVDERANTERLIGGSPNTNSSDGRPVVNSDNSQTYRNLLDVRSHISTGPSIDPNTGGSSKVGPAEPNIRKPKEESGDPNSEYTPTA